MRAVFAALLLILSCLRLQGHIVTQIPMSIELKDDKVTAEIDADAAYMLAEYRGNEDPFVPDLEWLRSLSDDQKQQLKIEAEAYLRQCLDLMADDRVLPWSITFPEIDSPRPAYMTEGDASDLPVLKMVISSEFPADGQKLLVEWQEPFSVGLLIKTHAGEDLKTIPIRDSKAVVAERSANGSLHPNEGTFGYWIVMGFEHILPEGIDHILFVLGLFLLAPKWKTLLHQTVTFTIAHSISLAAAVLGLVTVPSKWVEISIAASIAWVGLENLWVKRLGKGRLYLVGAFGLIHGLGFASAIADKLAEQKGALAPALLGFNLGVECGQVTVLVAAFILFGWWGSQSLRLKWTGSALIAVCVLFIAYELIAKFGWLTLPFAAVLATGFILLGWRINRFDWVKWPGSILVGVCGLLLVAQRLFDLHIFTWM